MFPSEEYARLCKSEEAKSIQERWEPRFGDLVLSRDAILGVIAGSQIYALAGIIGVLWSDKSKPSHIKKRDVVWLPRQDQLMEMLLIYCPDRIEIRYIAQGHIWQAIFAKEDEESVVDLGSCPEIALLECLLAVGGK